MLPLDILVKELQQDQDVDYYLTLCDRSDSDDLITGLLEQPQHEQLAIIEKLSQLCFKAKKSKFVREGSKDFLGSLLYEYICKIGLPLNLDEDFVTQFEKLSYGERYDQTSVDALQMVMTRIYKVADQFAKDKDDPSYVSNLAQNIFNKVFIPFATKNLTYDQSDSLKKAMQLQQWISKPHNPRNFFKNVCLEQAERENYNQLINIESEKEMVAKQAEQQRLVDDARDFIETVKTAIEKTSFKVGNYILFKGGVVVDIEGNSTRLPHRVAEIYQAIKQVNIKNDPIALRGKVKEIAKKAIVKPRPGRMSDTTCFYQEIFNGQLDELKSRAESDRTTVEELKK